MKRVKYSVFLKKDNKFKQDYMKKYTSYEKKFGHIDENHFVKFEEETTDGKKGYYNNFILRSKVYMDMKNNNNISEYGFLNDNYIEQELKEDEIRKQKEIKKEQELKEYGKIRQKIINLIGKKEMREYDITDSVNGDSKTYDEYVQWYDELIKNPNKVKEIKKSLLNVINIQDEEKKQEIQINTTNINEVNGESKEDEEKKQEIQVNTNTEQKQGEESEEIEQDEEDKGKTEENIKDDKKYNDHFNKILGDKPKKTKGGNIKGRCFSITDHAFVDWDKIRTEYIHVIRAVGDGTERGKKLNKLHSQVYIQFYEQVRKNYIKKICQTNKLYIRLSRGTNEQNLKYISKDGKYKISGEFVEQGCRTDKQLLKKAIKDGASLYEIMNEHTSLYLRWSRAIKEWITEEKQQMGYIDAKKDFEKFKLRKWQIKMFDVLKKQNDREILWIYDDKGNAGKSTLGQYISAVYNGFYCSNGKTADILYSYDKQPYVIYDIKRTLNDKYINYNVMESFKDGHIFSSKYESKSIYLSKKERPKIIIMSNRLPNIIQNGISTMTNDRWKIYDLENDCYVNQNKLKQIQEINEEITNKKMFKKNNLDIKMLYDNDLFNKTIEILKNRNHESMFIDGRNVIREEMKNNIIESYEKDKKNQNERIKNLEKIIIQYEKNNIKNTKDIKRIITQENNERNHNNNLSCGASLITPTTSRQQEIKENINNKFNKIKFQSKYKLRRKKRRGKTRNDKRTVTQIYKNSMNNIDYKKYQYNEIEKELIELRKIKKPNTKEKKYIRQLEIRYENYLDNGR